MRKWIAIGLYSPKGTSCSIYCENGKPKRFGNLEAACAFIAASNLGASASPVEVYEE